MNANEVYWAAGVVVVDQAGQVADTFAAAVPDRHLQGVQDQVGGHLGACPPPDDAAGEHVEDERHEDGPGEGRDVGEVRDPQLVGCGRGEVPLDPVLWTRIAG